MIDSHRMAFWSCPSGLSGHAVQSSNHPGISVVVWDPLTDTGYQIIGVSKKVEDVAMMDGIPDTEEQPSSSGREKNFVHIQK